MNSMEKWKPKNFEDMLLYQYWSTSKGSLFLEVPIGNRGLGNWPLESKIRRIDGIIVISEKDYEEPKVFNSKEYTLNELLNLFQKKTVELIEVKKNLNRLVIGQVIAGMDMFERQYQANIIVPVILCQNGDPALEWVCRKRNIKVQIIRCTNS